MGNSGRFPQENIAATESRYSTLINYEVHARSFRASIAHRTLTRTTRSLTCIRDSFLYTRGLGTSTASQHNIFDSEKLSQLSCAPDAHGVRTSGLSISSPTLYQLSHAVTPLGQEHVKEKEKERRCFKILTTGRQRTAIFNVRAGSAMNRENRSI